MKIVDALIILFLLLGAVIGFKKGFIKTLVSFVGIFITIILALYLKQPVVNFLYAYFPFFSYGGFYILNIFVYESIAFFFIFTLLSCILGIILNITGIIEKLLNATIILGIVSKILGAIAGVLEMLLFIFVGCFVLSRINYTSSYIQESKTAKIILARTPIIANIAAPTYKAFDEVYELQKKYAKDEDKSEYNREALMIIVKYRIISKDQALKLVKDGKVKINNPDGFIIV